MKKTRKRHSPEFKAKVALEALREQETIPELARRYKLHVNVIYKWKRQLMENMHLAFESENSNNGDSSQREAELLKKIGELTM